MQELPEITWIDENAKTDKELDALQLHRFNIKNFTDTAKYHLQNYYVFKIPDNDKDSSTGYYGMCIQKQFAQEVKQNLEAWKKITMKK